MKQVTSKEFYKVIGPLDVTLTLTEDYPYTTYFKLRNGETVGRIAPIVNLGFTTVEAYYLMEVAQ